MHDQTRMERSEESTVSCSLNNFLWTNIPNHGVREHIRKVHSRDKRCERCHTRYPKQDQLENHIAMDKCAGVEETDPSRPELMTAEQEEIFVRPFEAITPEDKWKAYYQFLFPDAPNRHSINPCEFMRDKNSS